MSSAVERQETAYYSQLDEEACTGLEQFNPKDFIPSKGCILIVLPPKKERSDGGIFLPTDALVESSCGRVAAVPTDSNCPVEIGDWVVMRVMGGDKVPFEGRSDMRLLHYTDDASSDILGFFKNPDCR